MTNENDYLPKATSWFTPEFTYTGLGRIEFSNPKGWIEGEATCVVSRLGEMAFMMKIGNWENEEALDKQAKKNLGWLLSGIQISNNPRAGATLYSASANNEITTFCIGSDTDEKGKFTGDNIFQYKWHRTDDEFTIHFEIERATYTAPNKTVSDAEYWVLPCTNLDLWQHSIFHTLIYEDVTPSDLQNHPLHPSYTPHVEIGFKYNDAAAFIIAVEHYNEIIEELRNKPRGINLTSIMFGKYSSENDKSCPADLLSVLGLATSCSIGASWIELRDKNANLICRRHGNFSRYRYSAGYRAVDNDYLGLLLTEASKSENLSDRKIQGILRTIAHLKSNLIFSGLLRDIFTSFDDLFEFCKINERIQPPSKILEPVHMKEIEAIVECAQQKINALADNIKNSDSDQAYTIYNMASNLLSLAKNKQQTFGHKLIALLKFLEFSDLEVIDKLDGGRDSWITRVNKYRNTTMHSTYYEKMFERDVNRYIHRLIPHLHDILIRATLKSLGYTGEYNTRMGGGPQPIDWVKPSTHPSDLGYG